MSTLHLISHPLVQHKLTLMRQKDASTNSFRRLLDELSTLMAYEVTRDMPLQDVEIETPLETMTGQMIDGKKLVLLQPQLLRHVIGVLVAPAREVDQDVGSLGSVGATRMAQATAWALSSAGMMPSTRESCMKASRHSWSVTDSYCTRPMSLR
jgi:uracil phosphoribosyltransferase